MHGPSYASSSEFTCDTRSAAVFDLTLLDEQPGIAVVRVRGRGNSAEHAFAEEAGGHRWQRIPPNDKRGRMQTSTITIAVLPEPTELARAKISAEDIVVKASRGSGAGGQHRNKTNSAIDMVHVPTGIVIHSESQRSQHQNRALAAERLAARITSLERDANRAVRDAERRTQVGSGMRGDKRRTIRCQDDSVVDHPTGRSWRVKDYLRGEIPELSPTGEPR